MAPNAMMQAAQGAPGQQGPQAPQITPEQAADARVKMNVTGQAIQQLLSDPNSGPKQAIQLVGSIIANNPDHFDANWGAGILTTMPDDPGKFRGWLMQQAQQQAQLHQVLDKMHPMQPPSPVAPAPPPIDPAELQHASAHRATLEPLLGKKDLAAKDFAHHIGMDEKHLPEDKEKLRDLLAAHYVHAVGHEADLSDVIRGQSAR